MVQGLATTSLAAGSNPATRLKGACQMTAQEKFDEFVRDTTVLEHFAKLTLDTKREILRDWLLGEDVSDQCEEVLFDVRGDFTPKQHRELGVALVSSFKGFLNDDRKDWLNEHLETDRSRTMKKRTKNLTTTMTWTTTQLNSVAASETCHTQRPHLRSVPTCDCTHRSRP
jgi:hypothetical protein